MLAADIILIAASILYAKNLKNNAIKVCIAVAALSVVITLFIPHYPIPGLISGIRKSFLILIAITLGSYVPLEQRKYIHNSIMISCGIVAAYAIKQHFLFDNFDNNILQGLSSDKYTNLYEGNVRAFSLLSSGFHCGAVCIILVSYALFYPHISRVIGVFIFLLSAAALTFTYTRTCIIISALLVVAWALRQIRVPLVFAVPACVAFYSLLLIVAPDEVRNPFAAAAEDTRFTGRSASYLNAAASWDARPTALITGFGIGSAGSAQGPIFEESGNVHIEPHNIFLKYVFEMGVILGLTFLAAMGMVMFLSQRAAKLYGHHIFIYALIFSVTLAGLTITIVEAWPANIYFFLIIGMYLRSDSSFRQSLRARPQK